MTTWLAIVCVLVLAAVHSIGGRIAVLGVLPRNLWLSFAGGVTLSYVFMHILPELHQHQQVFSANSGGNAYWDMHVYLLSVAGVLVFYGIERLALHNRRDRESTSHVVFWAHIASYALYNLLIGYLLLQPERDDPAALILFTVAIGLHFLVNDQFNWEHHKHAYRRFGRWILSASVLLGFAVGLGLRLEYTIVSALFAFLAGGIVINVLKEELPAERQSRFWPFALGAALYSTLMMFVW